MNAPFLSTQVRIFNEVRDQIAKAEELSKDDPFVIDTADGETSLTDMLVRMLREANENEADADACRALIKERRDRAKRLDARADKIRAIVLQAMQEAGLPKLKAPDFSASTPFSAPSVAIVDEEAIPDDFCRIVREPDKNAILRALKDGKQVPGCALNNPRPYLRVSKG